MADGRIVIDTEIDVSGAKEGVKNLTSEQIKVRNEYRKTAREIALLQEQIKDMETPKIDTGSLEKYETKLQEAYGKIVDLDTQLKSIEKEIREKQAPPGASDKRLQEMYEESFAWKYQQQEIKEACIEAEKYEKEIEKIKAAESTNIGTLKYKKAVDSLAKATDRLEMLGKKTKEVDAKQTSLVKKMKSIGREGQKSFNKASNSAKKFAVRLRSIIASAFIFNIISSGLRQFTTYMGSALKTNKQFSTSMAAIKGNLLTAFQPIYNAVMPALNSLMAGLQKVTGYIASFLSTLFGTSIKASQESAKELYEQSSALDSVADSAKKANKQLSDIDELQVLNNSESTDSTSGSANSTIVPTFGEIEVSDELPVWLQKSMETIENLIEDWKIGDFFSVGEDVSDLVIQINEFIANAISSVDWETLGKNVGAFLRGIKWLEVFKSIGDVIGAALDGAIEFWFGAFSEAPFETALITAMALWKLTGVGSFMAQKINTALGTSLPTGGFSIKSALKVIFELLLAFKIGDKIGSDIAKMLDNEVADILGEDTFFDYVFKYGVSDGLEELGSALNEMMTEFVTGIPSQVKKLAESINDTVKEINSQKIQLAVEISNIDGKSAAIGLVVDKYYELSQKSKLSDEDLQTLAQYKKQLEEFGANVEKYINPETNAWTGTREALDEVIEAQTNHLKILAYQDSIVEGEKSLLDLENKINDAEKQIDEFADYDNIISQIEKLEKAGYSLQEILNATDGEGVLKYYEYFEGYKQSDVRTAKKLYDNLKKATAEYSEQTRYVNGLYAEVDILNGNVEESNELIGSGVTQLSEVDNGIHNIESSSEKVTNNVKSNFKNMADKGIEAALKLAGGTNEQLNKIKKIYIQASTSQAEKAVTQGVSAMNIGLGLIKTPSITAKTSLATTAVTNAVASANRTLEMLKTPSINIETSTALSKTETLRNSIETALKGINIGLKVSIQEKVMDAMTAAINIGKAAKLGIGQIEAYSVPYLASGAVIPPNKEFMAVLGDQKHGMNIEAPADLIKQMVMEGVKESGTTGDSEIIVNVYLEGDAEGVFKLVKVENEKVRKQTGNSAFA